MASEELLVDNDLTVYGLRRMHVTRMGGEVDASRWYELVPNEGMETLTLARHYDKALDVHHLWLLWHCREVITLAVDGAERLAVLWWIGEGETLRWAADLAACTYRMRLGKWATRAVVRNLPAGATEEIEASLKNERARLRLERADWVPQRHVVVLEG